MTKILIVEDEKKIARFMELELVHEGYAVEVSYNGKEGFEKFKEGQFNLILLDIMLPELNGMELCRKIRSESDIPVIMVTAKDGIFDKVKGLDFGADDYICKPFAIEELLARIRALLRRRKDNNISNILKIADLVLDKDRYRVKRDGQDLKLTKTEYDLLTYFLENKDIVLTREQILQKVWGYNYQGETNVVDVYIRYLRTKIDDPYDKKLIHTIRGVGYVLRDELT
jgi:two-component system, OmpR family, response regulator ArlR